jgi:hypothetical protein
MGRQTNKRTRLCLFVIPYYQSAKIFRVGNNKLYKKKKRIAFDQHSKNLVVTLTQNLLKSDVAQKVVQGKLI